MTIHAVDQVMAVARLSQISFKDSLDDVAIKLANWQISKGSLQVPLAVNLSELKSKNYKTLVAQAREHFANKHPMSSAKPQIMLDRGKAWCLGDVRNQTPEQTLNLAKSHPEIYIRLVLMSEILATNAIMAPAGEVSAFSSLGPSVYMTQGKDATSKTIKTFRAEFMLNKALRSLTCDITRKVFFLLKHKQKEGQKAKKSSIVDAGDQNAVTFEQLDPEMYGEADARGYPVKGIALNDQVRSSRIYYLNVLLEQVCSILKAAGVKFRQSTFQATHQVTEGFINADEVAHLARPLRVIWNTEAPMPANLPSEATFDHAFGFAGAKKAKFQPGSVSFEPVGGGYKQLRADGNYLFLNDRAEDESGSITLENAEGEITPADAYTAYRALEEGTGKADLYTTVKYKLLMDAEKPHHVFQAMHESPELVVKLLAGHEVRKKPEKNGDPLPPHQVDLNAAAEPLRRCLMELALKEIAAGYRPLPTMEELKAFPQGVQLVATRRLKLGRRHKVLVSYCRVEHTEKGVMITERKTSKWSDDECDLDDFVDMFPFLSADGRRTKDDVFWIIDPSTGDRLRVSMGRHVPKILINNRYDSFEKGLEAQPREERSSDLYSKDKKYNLFPYYGSSVDGAVSNLSPNSRIVSVQDMQCFLRVFIAPAGGLNAASGSPLSLFRDVMLYGEDKYALGSGLIEHPLTNLYLHSFTSGVLVIGENSKMSLLEKISRLGIEN
ncbi:hypothetical protein [Pseudomonas putida]|uniref:Uncharacterized protein n=1 Tax=Pseudomonas putida TaxID=303 RepID=A0A8I1JHV6_PSEPU|nr:hypothetical protein [Pseudomonas putida]MBI6882323.1 hypothetical protein [Pseudomonas putida]